jgi:hypothetical protein
MSSVAATRAVPRLLWFPLSQALERAGRWDTLVAALRGGLSDAPEGAALIACLDTWEGAARVMLTCSLAAVVTVFTDCWSVHDGLYLETILRVLEDASASWDAAQEFIRGMHQAAAAPRQDSGVDGQIRVELARLAADVKAGREAAAAAHAAAMSATLSRPSGGGANVASFDSGAWRRVEVWQQFWTVSNVNDLIRDAQAAHDELVTGDVHRFAGRTLLEGIKGALRAARLMPDPQHAYVVLVGPAVADFISYYRVLQYYLARRGTLEETFLADAFADVRATAMTRDDIDRELKSRAKTHTRPAQRWGDSRRSARRGPIGDLSARPRRPTSSRGSSGRSSRGSRSPAPSRGSSSQSRKSTRPRGSGA